MFRKSFVALLLLALPLAAYAEDFVKLLDAGQVRIESVQGTGGSTGTVLDGVIENLSGRDLEVMPF